MSEEELLLSIIAIVFGVGFAFFIMYNIFSLIRAGIERKSGTNSDINPQFFKALGEFKKQTERRITHLEAIVTDLEEDRIRVPESSDSTGDIEIEEPEARKESKSNDGNNLRNMLNE